jgi:polysaccharide transporter, PST family
LEVVKIKFGIKNILMKSTVKNGIWMYLLQVFNTIVPLLTLPYITRILGASQYGVFSIAINIIGYYQVIVEYGYGMSATRKVAILENNDQNHIDKLFSCVLISRIILLAICLLISAIYIFIDFSDIEQGLSLMILMISLLGSCLQLNWLFQGIQKMKVISITGIVSRSVSVILIFIFVKTQNHLFLYCFLYAIPSVLNGILGVYVARKKFKVKMVNVSFLEVINELKDGWYVFTTQLSSRIFSSIGITFLGIFATSSEVGIYSAIQKIPNIMMLAWAPIAQVVYPVSSKQLRNSFEEGKKFVFKIRRYIFPVYILGALFVGIFSIPIVRIAFGSDYAVYYYWIIPLLAWMIVAINNNFLGVQILLGSGHDKEYSKCFQIGILCTVLFNFLFIFFFGGTGASIAPLLSEIVLGITLKAKIAKIRQ